MALVAACTTGGVLSLQPTVDVGTQTQAISMAPVPMSDAPAPITIQPSATLAAYPRIVDPMPQPNYMPDDEDKATVQKLQAQYPTAMPYFFTQDPDYVTVKERAAKFTATGEEAEGLATIGIAVETLRVAEYLTPTLMDQLK